MPSADAFDDPNVRTARRTPKVLTDRIESGPTVLRDPVRPVADLDRPTVDLRSAVTDLTTDDGWPVGPATAPVSLAAPAPTIAPPPAPAAPAPRPDPLPEPMRREPVVEEAYDDVYDDDVDDEGWTDEEAAVAPAPKVAKRSRRPRVRKVTRVVRRVDPWTVFKLSILTFILLYGVLLVAGVILWDLAHKTGTVDNVQGAVKELFGLESFVIDGQKLFRGSWALGAILALGGTGFMVTLAVLFNLLTDLVGGVRVTVLEEEYVVKERRFKRASKDA